MKPLKLIATASIGQALAACGPDQEPVDSVAGRLRGMSGFGYFCRTKSNSHQPAKLAAKRL